MSIYNQIATLVIVFVIFFIYKIFKNRASSSLKNQQLLTDDELNPFLNTLNLDVEKKVRKQWLVSFFAFTGIHALSAFLAYIGDGAYSMVSENTSPALSVIFGIFISFFILIFWFWITYHCAYKKRGTAWLMWTMISIPLRELADIGKGEWKHAAEWDSFGWFMVITFIGIEIFYWINCLRLRRVNAAREYQRILALKAKYGSDANGFCT